MGIYQNFMTALSLGTQAVLDRISWHGSILRPSLPRIRRIWRGEYSIETADRVAILVHYARKGHFLRYFTYFVKSLERAGYAVIVVTNSPRIDREGVRDLLPHCAAVVHRRNRGYDFGAWRDGMGLIPDLSRLSRFLITNDSIFGPLQDLGEILERCDFEEADAWGMTDCYDTRYHLQSYFMVFGPRALASKPFRKFWRTMRYVENKRLVVSRLEIGLSQKLLEGGMRLQALYPYRRLIEAIINHAVSDGKPTENAIRDGYFAHILEHVINGRPLNPTHYFWEYLVINMKFPFIKRDLVEKNPVRIPMLGTWRESIEATSNYPAQYIEEYLQHTSRNLIF